MDNSGPVSIDIPPGTYNGTQLAEAVEVAMRSAFGDDKKVQLPQELITPSASISRLRLEMVYHLV